MGPSGLNSALVPRCSFMSFWLLVLKRIGIRCAVERNRWRTIRKNLNHYLNIYLLLGKISLILYVLFYWSWEPGCQLPFFLVFFAGRSVVYFLYCTCAGAFLTETKQNRLCNLRSVQFPLPFRPVSSLWLLFFLPSGVAASLLLLLLSSSVASNSNNNIAVDAVDAAGTTTTITTHGRSFQKIELDRSSLFPQINMNDDVLPPDLKYKFIRN